MIPELGHFALILALLAALAQGTLPLIGAATGKPRLMAIALPAARAQALLVAFAFGCLAWSFISNDFSVQNVAANSNSELPLQYRVAATWGSHEGSLLLWTLVTVSVEWARHRELSAQRFARTTVSVVTNPVVAGILVGTAFGFTGFTLPGMIDETVHLLSQAAVPMSLVVLGMGLSEYGIRAGWRQSVAIAALKLAVAPLAVYLIARVLALPRLEMVTVVVMASLPVGANVYLMAREFRTMEGPVASSLVLTTALAAVTTPLLLALLGVAGN